jgi:hypothetical protein
VTLNPDEHAEARQIANELATLARTGNVLPGSIQQRHMRCGRAGCRCHADPPRLHGPYWHWTRKVKNKTVSRWLNKQQAEQYRAWIENDRRIRELVSRLEQIGIAHLDAHHQHD